MFQSIKYTKHLGYDAASQSYKDQYELTDSDFSCVVGVVGATTAGVVIQEYSKRNLNVAKNLLLYFQWCEKQYGYSMPGQIKLAEIDQPLIFTPQLKQELERYLILL